MTGLGIHSRIYLCMDTVTNRRPCQSVPYPHHRKVAHQLSCDTCQ